MASEPRCTRTGPFIGLLTPSVREQGPSLACGPPMYANRALQWPADPRCTRTGPFIRSRTPDVREHCRKIEQMGGNVRKQGPSFAHGPPMYANIVAKSNKWEAMYANKVLHSLTNPRCTQTLSQKCTNERRCSVTRPLNSPPTPIVRKQGPSTVYGP